jgi:hypothetical protein
VRAKPVKNLKYPAPLWIVSHTTGIWRMPSTMFGAILQQKFISKASSFLFLRTEKDGGTDIACNAAYLILH